MGAVEVAIDAITKRHIPMNIDGITAVVFCELGFEPELEIAEPSLYLGLGEGAAARLAAAISGRLPGSEG